LLWYEYHNSLKMLCSLPHIKNISLQLYVVAVLGVIYGT